MCHLCLGSRIVLLDHKNFLIVFTQNRFNSNTKMMKQILSSSRKRLTKKCCCWFWELLPRRQRRGDIDIIFMTIIIVFFIIVNYFLVVWTYLKNTSLNIIIKYYCSCTCHIPLVNILHIRMKINYILHVNSMTKMSEFAPESRNWPISS